MLCTVADETIGSLESREASTDNVTIRRRAKFERYFCTCYQSEKLPASIFRLWIFVSRSRNDVDDLASIVNLILP